MIDEDYVGFEVAKLLKEKGFYTPYCYSYYFPELKSKTPCISNRVIPKDTDKYLAPTLQMAMKWLLEVHNIFIDISIAYLKGNDKLIYLWLPCVIKQSHIDYPTMEEYMADSYEEACEAAIKYCLTNLI